MSSDIPADILPATRRGRWRVALLTVMAIATLAGFLFLAFPQLLALLEDAAAQPPTMHSLRLLQALFIGLGLLGVMTAAIVLHNGLQILRRGQTPPNDVWLWHDTPIVRGVKARRRGWINIVTALLTGLICCSLVVYIVLTLQRFSPYTLRDGVTMVEPNAAPR